jgi:hemolysin III
MKWILLLVSWAEKEKKRFSRSREALHEMGNWLSHGIGLLFGIPAGVWLLVLAWETQAWPGFLAVLMFVLAFNMLYAASSLYHYMMGHPQRRFFRKLDHISIFFMIAGTYTPFLVIYLDNLIGKVYLAILWLLVLVGIVYKLFLLGRYKWVSLLLYLFMGWMVVFNYRDFVDAVPILSLQWIVVGGVFYTVGVLFYIWNKLPFNHFIWHIFVFGGSLSHFIAVYYGII